MMKDRTDKEQEKYRRKLVPHVKYGIPEGAVCDIKAETLKEAERRDAVNLR